MSVPDRPVVMDGDIIGFATETATIPFTFDRGVGEVVDLGETHGQYSVGDKRTGQFINKEAVVYSLGAVVDPGKPLLLIFVTVQCMNAAMCTRHFNG